MSKRPKPLRCDRILERHAALGTTEVALSRTEDGEMVAIELITTNDDGSHSRDWITGMFPRRHRAKLARRMTDIHAGVVVSQRALGLELNRGFA